ncbi:phytanoyl-CoA dioxygenase PhyH [Ulvibacter sp. MAR_2010_11]|uniref:phytanoyl-CoA dioxygenase family protein n=1 Tax=Ulvibacter sp. MAR_2010_11 TaxID=1250229 RepID=UPI000C2C35C5|nr:phytanoyl-CoA dioxygenase family protein [Ulvibacter sp. MAR_2010_11]PKA83622.1 phytanoyl-CoA dioxygenase PhyH [Ulvibacter sp. MAR_2010_11]
MSAEICQLSLDGVPYEFNVEGEFFWGTEGMLYKPEDSVISKTPWRDLGYGVVSAFDATEFEAFRQSIQANIEKAFDVNGIAYNKETFTLGDYHKVVTSDALHLKVIDITRNLTNEDFDFNIDTLAERFGKILGYPLTSWVEELQKSHIQIRINRPSSLDINPPHRDGYLSYWEDVVNVWIPIEGCNENTSLPVLPGSHLIPENEILRTESKGATINGNTYYVPCVLKTKAGNLEMIRPNPKQGEALLFSPFLIHGAAVNRSTATRVSIELRFPKIKTT